MLGCALLYEGNGIDREHGADQLTSAEHDQQHSVYPGRFQRKQESDAGRDKADPGGHDEKGKMPGTDPLRQKGDDSSACDPRHSHGAFGEPVMFCRESEDGPYQIGEAYDKNSGQEHTYQSSQKQESGYGRLFPEEEMHAGREIFFYNGPDALAALCFPALQPDETFQERSHKETEDGAPENRAYAESGVKNTSGKGCDQRGPGLDLADNGISSQDIVPGQHLGDAGLYGRGFEGAQYREDDQESGDHGQIVPAEGDTADEHGNPGKRVQGDHDLSSVRPVRQNAAEGGHQDHGKKGKRGDSGEDGSGAGLFQDIHGQSEFQRVVSDQGTDLSQEQEQEIA